MPETLSQTASMFEEQRHLLSYFFDNFAHEQAERFVQLVLQCSGTVVFSGVGKSGFICGKMAASFASIGIRAIFLNPLDALHGDLGNLSASDILVLVSKSGSTDELISLIPSARRKGVQLVSITCNDSSKLAGQGELNVYLPLERELCSYNLAPVTSTVLQLIFGDTVTAILMRKKQLSLESFALNHPAGAIGRKLVLEVQDVMLTGHTLPVIHEKVTLADAVLEMSRSGVGCAIIVQNDVILGIFTDGDLRRLISTRKFHLESEISTVMTRKVRTIEEGTKLVDAKHCFTYPTTVSCLPVVGHHRDGRKVLRGLLTFGKVIETVG